MKVRYETAYFTNKKTGCIGPLSPRNVLALCIENQQVSQKLDAFLPVFYQTQPLQKCENLYTKKTTGFVHERAGRFTLN